MKKLKFKLKKGLKKGLKKENSIKHKPIEPEIMHIKPEYAIDTAKLSSEEVIGVRKKMKGQKPDTIRALESIQIKSTYNPTHVFKDLYQLLLDKELLLQAAGTIIKKKGATTEGVDQTSTDSLNLGVVTEIIDDLKSGNYKFKPTKKLFVDKKGKKLDKDRKSKLDRYYNQNQLNKEKIKELKIRVLGVLTTKDKIIAESLRLILNAIYEPEFVRQNVNFGFRPGLGSQDAIKHHVTKSKANDFILEADVKGAFDNVDHDILIRILRKKIDDERILLLIKNGLKCGIFYRGVTEETKIGTTQGSNLSPLLYNIYFNEFDNYINNDFGKYIEQTNKNENRIKARKNSLYVKITKDKAKVNTSLQKSFNTMKQSFTQFGKNSDQYKKAFKDFKTLQTEYKRLDKFQKRTPTLNKSRTTIRYIYTRYADDWILSTNAKLETTITYKEMFTKWLKDNLSLELSEQKTSITNLKDKKKKAKFLGFTLSYYSQKTPIISTYNRFTKIRLDTVRRDKILRISKENKTLTKTKRISHNELIVAIDKDRLLNRLIENRFIKKKRDQHFGRSKPEWTVLQAPEIVERYNQIIRGYLAYYSINLKYKTELNYIVYLLQYSCLHTLANKYNTTISKIIKKYGKSPKIKWKTQINKKVTENKTNYSKLISWDNAKNFIRSLINRNREKLIYNESLNIDEICTIKTINWRTSFKLQNHCCICGSIGDIEYHHVRHIKVGKVEGFLQVMQQLNRKQIPTCKQCHNNIHAGKYNGLKLADLYNANLIIL